MTRHITCSIDGTLYDQWFSAEVTRDLKDFSGSFSFECRDATRSIETFEYATPPAIFRLRPGSAVDVHVNGQLVLKGFIETVAPQIDSASASVTISGKDKAGDLIDSAAVPEGPAEFTNVKLEDAAKKIAAPFGLSVRSEIDTGESFPRYGLDLAETGHSAIEKGARQRHALVMSDGVGGIVITRTGGRRAPADLTLPGNVKASSGSFTHKGRHSKVTVRGQAEKAATARDDRTAPLEASGSPKPPEGRQPTDGSATDRERRGVTATGTSIDDEITRYRPTVHLARSKADEKACADEADWRMRTARGQSEEMSYTVYGFDVGGRLWKVNEMTFVDDSYQGVERDMLISAVTYREDDSGGLTEITVTSPEAFDKQPVKGRRKNLKRAGKKGSKKSSGPLDGSAQAL